jgi:hypothetical protein
MTSFRDLADKLSAGGDEPLADPLPAGIVGRPDRPTAFTEPTLSVRSGDLEGAQVVLVAAPAAVGKSAFANALAADRKAPLWNLGRFPVGSGTFLGKLTEAHGIAALSSVTQKMSGGRYCLILDALDEGYSLARSDNFEAFVSDMGKQLSDLDPPGPTVVACGRTDTADLCAMFLEEAGVPTVVMALDFFDEETAIVFIDRQLDASGHEAHRRHRGPFEEARDGLFRRMREALATRGDGSDDLDAQSFLGYAPVLIALSEYLKVGDYQALSRELDRGATGDGGEGLWAFLTGIIEDLLIREQPKLIQNLPSDVRGRLTTDDLERLYSPAEQCDRLLARAADADPPQIDLDPAILPGYEQSVDETIGEHPFVGSGPDGFASVVFRDYVLGRAIVTRRGAEDARRIARSPSFRASPLLLRFAKECAAEVPPSVDSGDIEILYASAYAEDGVTDAGASLTVDQRAGGLNVEIGTPTGDLVEFAVDESVPAPLRLGPNLRRADIVIPDWPVEIGPAGAEAVVGPDATIECRELRVTASSLRVASRDASEPVILSAISLSNTSADFHLAGADRDRLKVVSDQPSGYPWSGYVVEGVDVPKAGQTEIATAFRDLKNLTTRFKPGPVKGRAPTLPKAILEVLVDKGRISRQMAEFAEQSGLVVVDGQSCFLHPQQFGMNVVDIRAQRLTEAVEAFLRDFLAAQ